MTGRDLLEVAARNLWRIKLRAVLTIAGVVIAIATFVAMLSFAAGNQRYFSTAFNEFGLLHRMSVTPRTSNAADTTRASILDNAAVKALSALPGVRLAYPYSEFDVRASVGDTVVTTSAQSLPADAVRTTLYGRILGGATFSSGTAREAIVTRRFADLVGSDPDPLVGQRLVVSMRAASLDSAVAEVTDDLVVEAARAFRELDPDSISEPGYRRRLLQRELAGRLGAFMQGLMERQTTVSDTLTIIAVAPDDRSYRFRISPIVVTERTARRLSSAGLVIGDDPTDLLAALREGSLFDEGGAYDSRSYPRVTLELEPLADHGAVKDTVWAMGYRGFSFAEQFEEMQRFMLYYYLGLGVIGLIALVTASLGIINTLVMSITERRREIGILKSLGADEGDIRRLFLVESAVIGAVGSAVGILIGWLGTRVVALILQAVMEREDMPVFDPFALPPWLIGLGLFFGIAVSLLAGLYPAARAARVDPVEALRGD